MSLSSTPAIDLNHPSLNTPITLADPDRPYLQHGLEYDEQGSVRIKPKIEAKMRLSEIARVHALIAAGRLSEANSITGCGRICKPLSECPEVSPHEVKAARTVCDKPLLHEDCARAKRRLAKFVCAHPELAEFLISSRFEVLTFTIPGNQWTRASQEDLHRRFVAFTKQFVEDDPGRVVNHSWARSVSLSATDGNVEGRVIHHSEKKLLGWPALNAMWKKLSPPGSTLSIRTYDGHDGDTQEKGLLYAMTGFEAYWMVSDAMKLTPRPDPLKLSEEFRDYDLTSLHGGFREFENEEPLDPPPLKCATCGKDHVSALDRPLMTYEELEERYGRIIMPTYGMNIGNGRRINTIEFPYATPSPPK
jgi:hypothetical protein